MPIAAVTKRVDISPRMGELGSGEEDELDDFVRGIWAEREEGRRRDGGRKTMGERKRA